MSEFLKKFGPMSNADLARKAAEHPHFSKLKPASVDKYVDRFVDHYEYLGILARVNGRLEWLPQASKPQEEPSQEKNAESHNPTQRDIQHETVQKLIRDMAEGNTKFRDKPLQKELRGMKGKLYDEFMRDIDLYNRYKNTPLISDEFERRVFEMALKFRAYGFIEEKESTHLDQHENP